MTSGRKIIDEFTGVKTTQPKWRLRALRDGRCPMCGGEKPSYDADNKPYELRHCPKCNEKNNTYARAAYRVRKDKGVKS